VCALADWGTDLQRAFLDVMAKESELLNGARVVRSWVQLEGGNPVLYVVYRHPWWDFMTGLRWVLDFERTMAVTAPDAGTRHDTGPLLGSR
jgi:hypothetical protein